MKQIKLCRVLLLIAMSLPLLVSCGGDDEPSSNGNNGSFSMIDGVHVNSKKLLYLDIYQQGYDQYLQKEITSDKIRFAMAYDSKGRLIEICAPYTSFHPNDPKNYYLLMKIDYDLKKIEYLYEGSKTSYLSCSFALNNKGFISRLGDCGLTYDDEGYLIGAYTEKNIWTFAYNDGDITKYMVKKLKSGNIDIFYAHYGEKEGDLYFSVNDPDGFFSKGVSLNYDNYRTISVLIAYHAGLFGNISKHCTYLPNSSSKNAIVERFSDEDNNNKIYHCSFVFD